MVVSGGGAVTVLLGRSHVLSMGFMWSGLVMCVTGNFVLAIQSPLLTQAYATLRGSTGALCGVPRAPSYKYLLSVFFFTSIYCPFVSQACATLRGHTDALRAVAWSPDNSTLITTSTDRSYPAECINQRFQKVNCPTKSSIYCFFLLIETVYRASDFIKPFNKYTV